MSVELFEHMRNHELLPARLAGALEDEGLLSVHLELAYAYTNGWDDTERFTA